MKVSPPEPLFVGSSELADLMRGFDWARTAVGPVEQWPQSVRAILRMMLTSRYAMWMGWGPDLTFFYNDAYAGMTLGAKHPWALGKPARQVWAEIWLDIGPRIEHVLASGEATWDEGLLLFLERNGFPEETYHTFSYSPLHDDDGRIAGMFCVVTEETTRLIGERRLALLRELGSQLASSQTQDDVWRAVEGSTATDTRDLPFTLTYLSAEGSGHAMLASASNVPPGDLIAPRTIALDSTVWPIRAVMDGASDVDGASGMVVAGPHAGGDWPRGPWENPPSRALVLRIAQHGQTRPAGVFIAGLNPFRPVDADYRSFVTLFVGQLAAGLANAQAYAAERRRAEALAQIDRAKTTFFSNVSHELRTPLTLILGPTGDALVSPERALKGESLELVYRNGLRLRKLVNALLDFSRIEAGRADARYEPVDLGGFTAELASAFRSTVERAGVRFVVDCPPGGPAAHIDRDMWERVVLNLISNALKFTFEGEIRVSVECDGDYIRLQVRDTGTGIPRAELPHIFDRFHRVAGATGRTHEGTGIGLALVRELVRLHGGTIDVESHVGQGTTFTITIPLGSAHLPADRVRAASPAAATALGADAFIEEATDWLREVGAPAGATSDVPARPAASSRSTAGQDAARIVLADDNADMRRYLGHLLGRRWRVDVAADGREALAVAREHPPDLVITDVMMPQLDGFGLLRELRSEERTRHIPVMMLSARAGDESRLEGVQAGADDYLVKPFTARELVARVDALLLRARILAVEERSVRRVSAVFAQAPVPLTILRGSDHVIEVANESSVALLGRPVVGQRVIDAFPEAVSLGIIELLDHAYATGKPYVGRPVPITLRRSPDGSSEACFFDVVCQPLFDHAGAVEGIAVVAYDVTELASAREAAETANRAKDDFLAMLGHELRNPLAPILTALQLLRLRGVEAGERERTVIERQVRHLVGLVDDLLDISRITRGKIRLNPAPIELSEIIAKAIELASPLLEQHQHDLDTDVARQGLGVMADATRLAQVVSNLLTNAAKYTPAGGRISIAAQAEGDEVVLSVRDTGIGIAPDMLPRIFDLFTQDRQAIDRAQGGLGLGLAIVRSFVGLHGGSVVARSEGSGHGSEFTIRLPRISVDASTAREPARQRRAEASAPGLRVLVVDDNADAAVLLADALSASGHATATAHDGPAALKAGPRFRPDVAILDIGLPVMDGFELARRFRAIPELQRTRLIAVTGYGQDHDRRRSAAAGFDAHLVKPVDVDQLSRLVRTLVTHSEESS